MILSRQRSWGGVYIEVYHREVYVLELSSLVLNQRSKGCRWMDHEKNHRVRHKSYAVEIWMRERHKMTVSSLTCRGLDERERPGEKVSLLDPPTGEMGGR